MSKCAQLGTMDGGDCKIMPKVNQLVPPAATHPAAGTDENPRVTASQLVGNDSELTTLAFLWRVVQSDGSWAHHSPDS